MALLKKETGPKTVTIKDMLKKQKKKTVQETLPYLEMYDNGMFLNAPGEYSRMYSFMDTNFDTESEDSQESIMGEFKKVLNKFAHNVTVQYNIINEKIPIEKLKKDYSIEPKSTDIVRNGDDEDEVKRKESVQEYREEYNKIILTKIEDGRNDVRKTRYVTLAIEAPDILIANKSFITLENELNEAFKRVNKDGVHLCGVEERLSVLRAFFHSGNGEDFAKLCDKYRTEGGNFSLALLSKRGMTTKDLIAPDYMLNGAAMVTMGENLVAKSFLISDLPPDMESNFMSEISNIPTAMIVSVIHKTKIKQKALREVKMHNNSIKAEVVKANKQAFKENYDPSLMSEALIDAREEGSFLVQDITIRNQKLFYTTVTVTLLANSLDDMREFTKILQMKVEDYACQAVELRGQQMLGLKTSLPFAHKFLSIDRMLTTDSACAFFPFSIQELMDKRGHFYGLNQITRNMIVYNRKDSPLPNGLVFGKAGSGKTTFMNTLIDYISYGCSGACYQESEELFSYSHPDFMWQHYVPAGNGYAGFSLKEEARNGLRTDLDYLIIGEITGGEARDFLTAITTGHRGMCSVHSYDTKSATDRLAEYIMRESSDYTKEQAMYMLKEIGCIVYMENFKVKEISEIDGFDNEKQELIFKTVYRL